MPDYAERIRALRALGAEGSGATDAERKLANDKAKELEDKYGNVNSPSTDYRTVEDLLNEWYSRYHAYVPPDPERMREAERQAQDLLKNQWRWNDKYYDRHGKPRPNQGDTDDLYEDKYKYDETYDYDSEEIGDDY